jgi:hypothetical protein
MLKINFNYQKLIPNTEKIFSTSNNSMDKVLIKNNGFDPKWLETHFFYPCRHGLTRINLVDSISTKK